METFTVDNAAMGRAKVWEYKQEETVRENPCDTCKFVSRCTESGTDCFAFRRWTHSGNYSDHQINHLVRSFETE